MLVMLSRTPQANSKSSELLYNILRYETINADANVG